MITIIEIWILYVQLQTSRKNKTMFSNYDVKKFVFSWLFFCLATFPERLNVANDISYLTSHGRGTDIAASWTSMCITIFPHSSHRFITSIPTVQLGSTMFVTCWLWKPRNVVSQMMSSCLSVEMRFVCNIHTVYFSARIIYLIYPGILKFLNSYR